MSSLDKLREPIDIKDVEFRIQSIGQDKKGRGWCTILAYKDARVDTNRLNDVCGIDGWQSKYEIIDGQLFCSVGVYSEKINGFVWKQNVGTESYAEKEKGRASDAFKRACFSLGIGIELYSYPFLFAYLYDDEFRIDTNKKDKRGNSVVVATNKLNLNKWSWTKLDDKGVIHITAQDTLGRQRVEAR